MANKSLSTFILRQTLDILSRGRNNVKEEELLTLNQALNIYSGYYKSFSGRDLPKNPDPFDMRMDYLVKIISLLGQSENREEKIEEPKKQEASIPPELESLVAEYRQNQALLEEKEIKSSSQRSVAEQVKIAIAHSKIKDLALANRARRQSQGENFSDPDDALAGLGSPKSKSAKEALADTYTAAKEVAFTYQGFSKLPQNLQEKIISSAVELSVAGVSDIDTAIQASSLQINTSSLDETTKRNLATIPGGFVSTVYQEVVSSDKTIQDNESAIYANGDKIVALQKQGKIAEAKALIEENQRLYSLNDSQSAKLTSFINSQTKTFKEFEENREKRLFENPDLPDIKDKIELANKTVATLQNTLERNGVQGHLYTPMDDAGLLELAIRNDLPGKLQQYAGYDAEYSAALINHPKTQDINVSSQAILLYGKELTPALLEDARMFAQNNPNSTLGVLLKNRKDVFDVARIQLRRLSQSSLGKDILKTPTGLGKTFKPLSGFFGKISDSAGGFGKVIGFVNNPYGALRSWAGRKAGQFISKRLIQNLSNQALRETAELFLKNGIKGSVKKLLAQAAAKIAAKSATKLTLQAAAQAANVAPGLGIIIAAAIEVAWWIGEKTFGALKALSRSIYGEEVKARDFLIAPLAGVGTIVGGIFTFFGILASATIVAAKSAAGIVTLGVILGFFFYITSIVVAPLISTLVQLDSSQKSGGYIGDILPGCPNIWPVEGSYRITQGPGGRYSHYNAAYSQAVDIACPEGTPVISTSDGVISFAGFSAPYLNTDIVVVDTSLPDGTTFQVVYAHLSSIDVGVGSKIATGMQIGLSGTAGSGAHLHYEYKGIRYNQCPPGGLQLAEDCSNTTVPGPNQTCVPDGSGWLYTN